MRRILKPDGVLAFSTHQFIGWFPLVESACQNLGLPALASPLTICKENWNDDSFKNKLEELGFEVELEWMENLIKITPDIQAGLVQMIGSVWPMVAKDWSEEMRNHKKGAVLLRIERDLNIERAEKGEVMVRMAGPLFRGQKKASKL